MWLCGDDVNERLFENAGDRVRPQLAHGTVRATLEVSANDCRPRESLTVFQVFAAAISGGLVGAYIVNEQVDVCQN